jgi:DNA-binding HxlR family transcriptional regulator
MKNTYHLPCTVAQTLNLIGDKWTLLILRQLKLGHDTYKEIQDRLEGIPSNLLSERLKSLEADELITSRLYQPHPPRYQYILTRSGSDLDDIFHSLMLWGERNLKDCPGRLVHNHCGQGVEQQYYCSHCGRTISKEELSVAE